MNNTKLIVTMGCSLLLVAVVISHKPTAPVDKPMEAASVGKSPAKVHVPHPPRSGAMVQTDTVREVLSELPFQRRLKAVHSLGASLLPGDCQALIEYLQAPTADDTIHQTAALKNDLLLALREQNNLPIPFDKVLLELYGDASQNVVIRDYALQHLFLFYDAALNNSSDTRLTIAQEDRLVLFWTAVRERGSGIAGTAIIGLRNLSSDLVAEVNKVERGKVAEAALELAVDPSANELSRIPALQVCSEMRVAGALPLVRKIIQGSTSIPFRLSAVAAVARLGNMTDVDLMGARLKDWKPPLREAAIAAITTLRKSSPL